MSLADKREELHKKTSELNKYVEDRGGIEKMLAEDLVEFHKRDDELGPLHDEVIALQKSVAADTKNRELLDTRGTVPIADGTGKAGEPKRKTLIEQMTEQKAFDTLRNATNKTEMAFDIVLAEFKNTVALTDWNNPATRLPLLVLSAQEVRTVGDMVAQGRTNANSLTFIEETTFTNAAAGVAEGAAKPESALDFTERTVPVRKQATWIQATKEILDDIAGFESYVRGRLGFMLERFEESQLLTGTGAGAQITGFLNAAGLQTQAKGADPTPDAIYKAMTLIRNTGFAEPDGYVTHPTDWQDVKLLRTADGIYIWGPPYSDNPDRIWGLPVRITTAITQNTGLVGAFREYAQIFRREDATIAISTEHASNFVSNIVTILIEQRIALAIYRGAAFCSVTGI